MSLTPQQIRTTIEQYLKVLYPKSMNLEITFLVKDKKEDFWKVNIRFLPDVSIFAVPRMANLSIDSNGDITQFKEGWAWNY